MPGATPPASRLALSPRCCDAAGIVYRPRGPAIVALATYDEGGVSLAAAQEQGARVAALVR